MKIHDDILRGLGYSAFSTAPDDGQIEVDIVDGRLVLQRLLDECDPRQPSLLSVQREYGLAFNTEIQPCAGDQTCRRQRLGIGVCHHGYDMEVQLTVAKELHITLTQSEQGRIFQQLADIIPLFYDDLPHAYRLAVERDSHTVTHSGEGRRR